MAKCSFELSIVDGDSTANIETLTGEPPYAAPLGYPLSVETAAGTVREHGGQTCEWRFRALASAQWTALRAVLTAKSHTVWIRTRLENKFTYGYYTGVCVWPDPQDIERPTSPAYSTGEFVLNFRNLVAYTPTPPAP